MNENLILGMIVSELDSGKYESIVINTKCSINLYNKIKKIASMYKVKCQTSDHLKNDVEAILIKDEWHNPFKSILGGE